jgi:hypothetical protein
VAYLHLPIRVTILAFALGLSSCDELPDPQFERIGDSLKLNIAKVKLSDSANSAEFVFSLTNGGPEAVTACLGPSRSVSYSSESQGPGGTSFSDFSHPGCVRQFTIEPHSDMTWSEVLEVPHLLSPRVDVEIGVQVVNPRRCIGGTGCMSTTLKSNKQRIK